MPCVVDFASMEICMEKLFEYACFILSIGKTQCKIDLIERNLLTLKPYELLSLPLCEIEPKNWASGIAITTCGSDTTRGLSSSQYYFALKIHIRHHSTQIQLF